MGRANRHTGGRKAYVGPVRAVVAFGSRLLIGVDVDCVVRAGLDTCLASDASAAVEIDDSVRTGKQRRDRADVDAGSVRAVIAAHDRETALRERERTLLDVFHPGSIDPDRDVVLGLAGDRAGMTTDALPIIDDETVRNHESLPAGSGQASPIQSSCLERCKSRRRPIAGRL